ncbi:MAG: hypothetical protein KDA85_21905, partial [Planctomycetaceae bacterium]|nr:hypothetical protein [Planctomycetaceae bacterium]
PVLIQLCDNGLKAKQRDIVFDALLATLDARTAPNLTPLLAGRKQLLRSLVSWAGKSRRVSSEQRTLLTLAGKHK